MQRSTHEQENRGDAIAGHMDVVIIGGGIAETKGCVMWTMRVSNKESEGAIWIAFLPNLDCCEEQTLILRLN